MPTLRVCGACLYSNRWVRMAATAIALFVSGLSAAVFLSHRCDIGFPLALMYVTVAVVELWMCVDAWLTHWPKPDLFRSRPSERFDDGVELLSSALTIPLTCVGCTRMWVVDTENPFNPIAFGVTSWVVSYLAGIVLRALIYDVYRFVDYCSDELRATERALSGKSK